jgi:hypothetical protein
MFVNDMHLFRVLTDSCYLRTWRSVVPLIILRAIIFFLQADIDYLQNWCFDTGVKLNLGNAAAVSFTCETNSITYILLDLRSS